MGAVARLARSRRTLVRQAPDERPARCDPGRAPDSRLPHIPDELFKHRDV